jgi:porin
VVSAYERDLSVAASYAAPTQSSFFPIQSSETYIEATYQWQLRPWLQIQPDLQYVFNPGGGVANPNQPNARVGDEFVLGVRTNILF